ncbi:MAG: hypothetical protein GF315_09110 [candidate division Zixibacteria bacterium]|nr:hypothetical protein [candidate division Zixibacteria bacterium]
MDNSEHREHGISKEKAKKMIEKYRSHFEGTNAAELPDGSFGGFFGKKFIEEILAQPGCTGLRFYYAEHDDGQKGLVVVGVGENIYKDLDNGIFGDRSWPCPPYCPDEFGQ